MNYNVYEHEKLKLMREKHPEWIWNRGDTHVILGVPSSLEAFKTPAEPGNSFSPGPGTYGVSSWVFVDGKLHAPEEMPLDELRWGFAEGSLPILNSDWKAGCIAVSSSLFTDGDNETSDYCDYFTVRLTNESAEAKSLSFYLAFRSFGAAGGAIRELSGDCESVVVNGGKVAYADTPACGFGAVSYGETGKDISLYLKNGALPACAAVKDDSTWAGGAWEYKVELQPGEDKSFGFVFHLHANHWMRQWLKVPVRPYDIDGKRQAVAARWKELMGIGLDLPDSRYAEAFACQLTHLYMFTVANSIRITPISYPLWWLRDGAYVMNALNKGGLHEFCERACREIAEKDAFGGFGSEGDGPSDGIWVLTEHYLLTGDKAFLQDMFPHIERRARLLMQMRRADKPMKRFTEFVIPKCMLDPNTDIMCLPAADGLIRGRMDHHDPVLWINSFAYLAMKRTALCAKALGLEDAEYEAETEAIYTALLAKSRKVFGHNDRDTNSAFWPGGWASRDDEFIAGKFDEYWHKVRCPDGKHAPEPDWTYFEAGQAHNYMLLGQRDRAWVSIEWFLSHHTAPGLYTYPEGLDGNTALLWPRTRGWDDVNFVTPHGWTAAEVFLLLRDGLAREEDDTLVIGSGVPESWMDQAFSVTDLPTFFGKVSFRYDPAQRVLDVEVERMPAGGVRHELPGDVAIRLKA